MRMYQKYFVFFLCLSILLGGCGRFRTGTELISIMSMGTEPDW